MTHRGAEQCHERVSRELLDVASVKSYDTAQPRDDWVDHLEQLLRVEAIGESGETRHIREQRGDQPSLLGERAAHLDEHVRDRTCDEAPERIRDVVVRLGGFRHCTRATVPAELHPFRVFAAAVGTDPGRHLALSLGRKRLVPHDLDEPAPVALAVQLEEQHAATCRGTARRHARASTPLPCRAASPCNGSDRCRSPCPRDICSRCAGPSRRARSTSGSARAA